MLKERLKLTGYKWGSFELSTYLSIFIEEVNVPVYTFQNLNLTMSY